MKPPSHVTSPGRAGAGLAAGTLTGGLLSASMELVLGEVEKLSDLFVGGLAVTAVMLILALPIWAVFHRLGRRSWLTAVPLATLFGGGAFTALVGLTDRTVGAGYLAGILAMTGVFGASVGFVAWRVAYRRIRDRPEDVF